MTCDNIETYVQNLLEEIQKNIFQKALDHRTEKTITVDTYEEFKEKIEEGYFIMAHWDGTPETEEQVKNETKATIRCIPTRLRANAWWPADLPHSAYCSHELTKPSVHTKENKVP